MPGRVNVRYHRSSGVYGEGGGCRPGEEVWGKGDSQCEQEDQLHRSGGGSWRIQAGKGQGLFFTVIDHQSIRITYVLIDRNNVMLHW